MLFAENTSDWTFPNVVTIKSYDYVEQKTNAQFTNALSLVVAGLAIIAIGPISITVISLIERL